MIDLSVEIGSLRLKNPVLTASGTFGYADEFQDLVDLNEIGGIVTKTVSPPTNCRAAHRYAQFYWTSQCGH